MPRVELVTGPAAEPVTVAEMRAHIRQDTTITVDDTKLTSVIKSCRAAIEEHLGIVLLHTTYRVWYHDDEISDKLELPLAPLSSVSSVKLYDEDNTAVTATATTYYVARYGRRPFVALLSGNTWPNTTGAQRAYDTLVVEGVFGYDADGLGVSENEYLIAKEALEAWVFYLYANRGNMDSSKLLNATAPVFRTLPPEILAMLNPITMRRLG